MSNPMVNTPRFEDYWPVDVEQLRPNKSYDQMVAIRNERMRVYLNEQQAVRPELVEQVDCPVCGEEKFQQKFMKEGFSFVECLNCFVLYVNPCLKEEHVKQVYKHQSYSDIVQSLMGSSDQYRRERFGQERVQIINQYFTSTPQRPLRLLDIGCATGFFLEVARQDGWEVYGVEPNPYMADFAQKEGLDVRNESIEETSFQSEFFDAITLFEIIEHVKRPMKILEKVFSLLRPGGMVFVYTPNFDCAERLILGNNAHFIWGSNHLVYFKTDTLQRAFERVGFTVTHWETQGLDIDDMIWHFEHHQKYDMGFARQFRDQLQFLVNSSSWGKNLRMYAQKPQ